MGLNDFLIRVEFNHCCAKCGTRHRIATEFSDPDSMELKDMLDKSYKDLKFFVKNKCSVCKERNRTINAWVPLIDVVRGYLPD